MTASECGVDDSEFCMEINKNVGDELLPNRVQESPVMVMENRQR